MFYKKAMKLYGVTTTYNCEKMVPYVMKYAEEIGYDKFIVYDNESTDRTVEALEKYPFVEIRHYHTDHYDESHRISMLNEAIFSIPIEDDYMWATVCDFDEVIYYSQIGKETFKDYLVKLSIKGYNVCTEHIVNLVCDGRYLDENKFVHLQVEKCGYGSPYNWCKPILFRLDNLTFLDYTVGHHFGRFEYGDEKVKQFYNTKCLHVFHLKYIFGAEYVKKTIEEYNERAFSFSPDMERMEYESLSVVEHEFEQTSINSISTKAYLENKMLYGDDESEHDEELVAYPFLQ